MQNKVCFSCKESKPLSYFPLRKGAKDGHRGSCRECRNAQSKQLNREIYARNYRSAHKEKLSEYHKERNKQLKLAAMVHYGGAVCSCCGETKFEFLCFDHVCGGGTQHRKAIGNMGRQFYYWLKLNNYPAGYRILCYNCNMSLGFYNYCPHSKEEVY